MTKAWGIEIHGMTCVVFAETMPKARYIAVRGYWDAYGRRKGTWPRAIAWRESRYDQAARTLHQPGPFNKDDIERILTC